MPSIGELLKDRNFLSMLAGGGSKFGRGGAGEAIGVPTQQWIQSLATQEAVAKGEKQRQDQWGQLMEAIKLLGGLTPKEEPGPTSLKMGPDNMTLDITPPSTTTPSANGGQSGGAGGASPGSAFASPTSGGFDYKNLFKNISPFWQALGG